MSLGRVKDLDHICRNKKEVFPPLRYDYLGANNVIASEFQVVTMSWLKMLTTITKFGRYGLHSYLWQRNILTSRYDLPTSLITLPMNHTRIPHSGTLIIPN